MTDHTYKVIELVGSSRTTVEDAVNNALSRAAKTLHNLRWFQIADTRGLIDNGKVTYWQVTLKVGFTLDE